MNRKIAFFVANVLAFVLAFAASSLGQLCAQSGATTQSYSTSQVDYSNPDYSTRFKVGKVFYYMIDKAAGLVGVAPCTDGINDMYQYDIVVPETVEYKEKEYQVVAIGRTAFANCFNLTSVTMPETIVYIGTTAFWGTSLKDLVIPNSVEEIGDRCFKESIWLRSLHFGKNLKKVGTDLFVGCYNLQHIEVDPENTILASYDGILYNKEMTTLLRCPSFRKNVTKVTLPSTVTKLNAGAFEYCEYLTEIELNEGLKEIGPNAFYLCTGLETMKIPASVEKIANGSSFCLLASCNKFEVAPENTRYSTLMDGRLLFEKESKTAVSILYSTDLAAIVIPEEVEHIGDAAMMVIYENNHMNELYRGKGAQEIILPTTLKSIGAYAFSGTNIGSIKVPDGVEEIPNGMVSDCQRLVYVAIGKGCKKFGFDVFNACNLMQSTRRGVIRMYCEEPPVMAENSRGEKAEINEDVIKRTQLQVPEASLSKYLRADGWKKFLSVVKLEGQSIEEVEEATITILPAEGRLTIETTGAAPLYIYALDGSVVFSADSNYATVELPKGVYIVSYLGNAYKTYVY